MRQAQSRGERACSESTASARAGIVLTPTARLPRLLSDEPDMEIVAECENGRDAVNTILERSPDLVFLDIEMPELSGFEVLRALPEETMPAFVFVTAFN